MKDMNHKKVYVWKLAEFLYSRGMRMSGEELAEHLNQSDFMTNYGAEYAGGTQCLPLDSVHMEVAPRGTRLEGRS